MTASIDTDNLMEAIEIGVDKFFPKPIDVKQFLFFLQESANHINLMDAYKRQTKLLSEYKSAVDASNIVSKTDAKGIITYVNDEFCRISGYTREELIGRSHNILRHPNMPKSFFKELWATIQDKKIFKGVIENRRKDGSSYFVDATIVPILDLEGNIEEFLAIRHDITEFVNNKQKLYTNTLTGLPNRYKLSCDLATINEASLAVMNIDSLKIINDFYGNDIGDLVLIEVAKRLKKLFADKGFVVYKLSSDEYGILSEKANESFVDEILSGISIVCGEPIRCTDVEIVISFSVGIATAKEALLEKANMALEVAKKSRKHYAVYDDSMLISKNYEKNLTTSKILRMAIDEDWIAPYFQPIVNSKITATQKYETLVRIVKPDGEVMSPYMFLDVAKATSCLLNKIKPFCEVDELTGVLNLRALRHDLSDGKKRSIALINIDGFSTVNNAYGIDSGDLL